MAYAKPPKDCELTAEPWRAAMQKTGTRQGCFMRLRSIAAFIIFPTWPALIGTLRSPGAFDRGVRPAIAPQPLNSPPPNRHPTSVAPAES